MASPGWVTPGAATEGVTPLFFPEKPGDLFLVASSAVSSLVSSSLFFSKPGDLFWLIAVTITIFLLLSLGCHPLQGVTPHLFYLSDLVSPRLFLNLPTKNFLSGVTPWRVSPGAVRPLVTPLVITVCRATSHQLQRSLFSGNDSNLACFFPVISSLTVSSCKSSVHRLRWFISMEL